uniref:Uncharacterized protein n=1 Tax=Rhizophora mucronata TaxID=61149 RepID=A0A2P2NJM5_RHIMU
MIVRRLTVGRFSIFPTHFLDTNPQTPHQSE